MPRLKLNKNSQRLFFKRVKVISGMTWQNLADEYGFSNRSFRDWANASLTPPYDIVYKLSKRFKTKVPKQSKKLDPYWYVQFGARKGGLARHIKHGLVGDIESRRKGGKISQARRRENPEFYKSLGCNVRKDSPRLNKSVELA